MDMKLWREATKNIRRIQTEWRICFFSILLGVAGMFTSIGLQAGNMFLASVCLFILGFFVPTRHGTNFNPFGKKLPRTREVSADNPAVLRIILDYLKREVLAPKERFVKRVQTDTEALGNDLAIFAEDQRELEGRLRTVEDEQNNAIDLSALLRVRQLIPLIKQRLGSLNVQIAEAEIIVQPVVEQLTDLQEHLDRLTRDVRAAASLKALDKIDRRIPVNDQFLSSLRIATDRAKEALAELVEDSMDIQAAWAEVRLESTLPLEDELRLGE